MIVGFAEKIGLSTIGLKSAWMETDVADDEPEDENQPDAIEDVATTNEHLERFDERVGLVYSLTDLSVQAPTPLTRILRVADAA